MRASLEIVKLEVVVANVKHHFVHHLLTLDGAVCVDIVECILLQDNEVDKLALPEALVVVNGYTVVTEDVDLVVSLLTALYDSLTLVYEVYPILLDVLIEVRTDLGVLQILRV